MSREVRQVPLDWHHPCEWRQQWNQKTRRMEAVYRFKPLFDRSYADAKAEFDRDPEDFDNREPHPSDYMPDFSDHDPETLGYCMYESTTEGTPISPVFRSPEGLAHWLVYNNASAFADDTATYEEWMATIKAGWAPSIVVDASGPHSGVEWSGRNAVQT